MNNGLALTDPIRQVLFDTAQDMIRHQRKRQRVRGYDFEGVVRTKMLRGSMGPVSGYLFTASIESDLGVENNISYLVRPGDIEELENCYWGMALTTQFQCNN